MPATKKSAKRKREPVSRERALRVAVDIADAGGLAELTMRRIADELGVEAMSLYHHVPNKDAILDAMVDLVFTEIELPRRDVDWRTSMRGRAASMRAVLLRHRWASSLMESRTNAGMATLAHHDAVIGCLRAAGFSIVLTAHAYAVIDAYVYGFVHTEIQLPFETTEETHAVAKDMLARFPAEAFPHLAELMREHIFKPDYAFAKEFDYGLELILDGLARAHVREKKTR
jgi:AcrR family transcriptional regulator